MNINKYTFEELEMIIDCHMEEKENCMFVCDYLTKEFISHYIKEEYGIVDKNFKDNLDIEEYYITLLFGKYNAELTIENARYTSGNYRTQDINVCDYYIGTDMTEDECDEHLLAEIGTWSWFEIINNDECNKECDCEECCDCCEEQELISETIEEYVDKFSDMGVCPCCAGNLLAEFTEKIINIVLD